MRPVSPLCSQHALVLYVTVRGRLKRHLVSMVSGEKACRSFGSHWLGEEESLSVFAFQQAKQGDLIFGLDSFGDDVHIQIARQHDDGTHDLRILVVLRHATDEGAVYLQSRDGEAVQVAEGGVACAEVVHAQLYAEHAQLLK